MSEAGSGDSPVGIFDFGIGGLTVMREIVITLPYEDLIFVNDNINLDAGFNSDETVVSDSAAVARFLDQFRPKALVIACNTATAVALEILRSKYSFSVVGVIEPASRAAVAATKNGTIGVVGTNMTIRSNAYEKWIRKLKPNAVVTSQACPRLVPMIEDQHTKSDDLRRVTAEYLKAFEGKGIDTMILGCTHYPLIASLFADLLPGINLIDPASHAAKELERTLTQRSLLRVDPPHVARYTFYATDLNQQSDNIVNRVFTDNLLRQRVEWQPANL